MRSTAMPGTEVRQAAGISAQAADVVGLGALLHRRAHDHIVHFARLDAGASTRLRAPHGRPVPGLRYR